MNMNASIFAKWWFTAAAMIIALFVTACGGGGGGSSAALTNPTNLSAAYGTNNNSVATPLYSSLDPDLMPGVDAMAHPGPIVVHTYTPAQIRTAYQMPALPTGLNYSSTNTSGLTPAQLASLGAGQTIYIVGAFDDPNIATELDTFNRQFNLPTCTTVNLTVSQTLPLAAASTANLCSFSKVYADPSATQSGGTLSPNVPNYDAGWATEMALDVQWAHATAPLARIVLIEAADANQTSISNAIALANRMGTGVVSMSFGANEDTTTPALDSLFGQTGMTYVAATGDTGTASGPMWPSVSPLVLAVGGTTLTYNASNGTRIESAWSSTGGGTSQYVTLPSYQNTNVQGFNFNRRSVADVAFNGDPYTGQYVYTLSPGNVAKWISAGGTSLGTPQWAGMIAVLNAQKGLSSQGLVGLMQGWIYPAATSNGTLWGASRPFLDITTGNSGSLAAAVGYDIPTGLGTPNLNALICMATGSNTGACSTSPTPTPVSAAPLVSAQTVNGAVGQALTFNVQYTAAHAVTWTLSGNPMGMVINASGQVTWATPVAGNYLVTVTATDAVNQTTGTAVYAVNINAAHSVDLINVTLSGNAGVALTYNLPTSVRFSRDLLTYSTTLLPTAGSNTSSVPAGLTLSAYGQLSWASPVQGTYHVTVNAVDNNTNPVTPYAYNITLVMGAALQGPVINNGAALSLPGVASTALTATIPITDADSNVWRINVAISGAPAGMQFFVTRQGLTLRWPSPTSGTYSFTVTAVDVTPGHNNLTGVGHVTVTVP
jgi:subtilase family serine protease